MCGTHNLIEKISAANKGGMGVLEGENAASK